MDSLVNEEIVGSDPKIVDPDREINSGWQHLFHIVFANTA